VNWKQLLAKGEIKAHQTSKQELDNIRGLITRDLADAALAGLSADRQEEKAGDFRLADETDSPPEQR
jgi:hypothetical protein